MPTELGSESQVKEAAEESSWQKGAATGMQDSAFDAKMAKQDQDYKLIDDHREIDDVSEKTTPSKTPKSPQKTSKRPKTVPFKVTLLDTSDYEAGIEVSMDKRKNFIPEQNHVGGYIQNGFE
eukprot:XP_013989094.1 PREDICTED: band 4.1-like protein 1 [Salmo salar]